MALGGKDVLKLIVDADSAGATKEFDKLGRQIKTTVGDAEKGATGLKGKFGTAFQGLADRSTIASSALDKLGITGQQAGMAIASAIPAAGVAAAGALALFAAKGVQAFQSTALAADKFADSTGLGVEEASKWIAVADDVGVSAGTFQSAFVKMQKAIETNRGAFGDLVATAKDGSTDLSATFLNVITHLQGIEDPIKRANEASKFFGRGFAEVSEIITTDASELVTALGEVSEAQIIDEAEVEKAREFQAAMDSLGEVVGDLSIKVGEYLVPALTDLANITTAVSSVADAGGGLFGTLFSEAENLLNPVSALSDAWGTFNSMLGGSGDQAAVANAAYKSVSAEIGNLKNVRQMEAAQMTASVSAADLLVASKGREAASVQAVVDALNAENAARQEAINQQLAAIDSTFAVTAATNSFLTANEGAATAVDDTKTAVNEQQVAIDAATQAALGAATATVKYAQDQATLEGKTLTAKQSQDTLIGTLMKLASQSSGPVATAIGTVITKLQTVGAQHPNPTISANDQATPKINNVQVSLNNLNGKSATVVLNAIFKGGAAMSEANRFLSIARQANQAAASLPTRKVGGPVPGATNQPVPILAHGGEYVLSADVVDRIKRGDASRGASASLSLPGASSGGGGTNVYFNGTFLTTKAELGRMMDEALAESRRCGNRAA